MQRKRRTDYIVLVLLWVAGTAIATVFSYLGREALHLHGAMLNVWDLHAILLGSLPALWVYCVLPTRRRG